MAAARKAKRVAERLCSILFCHPRSVACSPQCQIAPGRLFILHDFGLAVMLQAFGREGGVEGGRVLGGNHFTTCLSECFQPRRGISGCSDRV